MKAVQKSAAEAGFVIRDFETPAVGHDDVLIKVKLASICGTDLHITQWDAWSASRIQPPLIYGHEFCGHVEAVGERVTHLEPGDYVSAEMHIACETCRQCMIGNRHICEHVKIAGIDLDGCYAGYIVMPKNQVIKLPDTIPFEYGACLDSLGNAVHTVSKGNVSGKSVLVSGCGPIGMFAAAVAKALGAVKIYASDISQYRLDIAKKAGADSIIKADTVDPAKYILEDTQGRGVDVVLEMSGNPQALNAGFEALALGGTMVLLGIPKSTVELDITRHIIFKEAKVLGVNGREIFKTWFLMLDLLASGKLKLDDIITHRFPLEKFGEAIELVGSGQSGKVLLEP